MGHVKETPNVALQAKLSENFDFSNRTLEESKEPKAAASNNPGEQQEENERDEAGQEEAENDDGGFFDNFQNTGPEPRGRGGRGAREATNQKDNDTFGAQSS